MYIKKGVSKGPKKKSIYFGQKKILFLLYTSLADVDYDVCDDQHKNCYKMIYNMSIFKKVDFLSIGICVIMGKGL